MVSAETFLKSEYDCLATVWEYLSALEVEDTELSPVL